MTKSLPSSGFNHWNVYLISNTAIEPFYHWKSLSVRWNISWSVKRHIVSPQAVWSMKFCVITQHQSVIIFRDGPSLIIITEQCMIHQLFHSLLCALDWGVVPFDSPVKWIVGRWHFVIDLCNMGCSQWLVNSGLASTTTYILHHYAHSSRLQWLLKRNVGLWGVISYICSRGSRGQN